MEKLTKEQEYEIYNRISAEHRETTGKVGAWGICILIPIWFVVILFGIDWNNLPEEWYMMFIPFTIMGGLLFLAIKSILYSKK